MIEILYFEAKTTYSKAEKQFSKKIEIFGASQNFTNKQKYREKYEN